MTHEVGSNYQKPRYAHDCERCVFLGQYFGDDLYFCDQGGLLRTVIARWGSAGSAYISGWEMPHGSLRVARQWATEYKLCGP